MGSKKGRSTMSWSTDNRIYLKACVGYMHTPLGIRGRQAIIRMDGLVPIWRDEFIGEMVHDLENALIQRADKVNRSDDFPSTPREREICAIAMRDVVNGVCTFNFTVSRKSPSAAIPPERTTRAVIDTSPIGVRLSDIVVVKRLRNADLVSRIADIIYRSGWDGIDIRGRMTKSPSEVFDFLRMISQGADASFAELRPTFAGLLKTIVDSWLYWAQDGMEMN